MATGTERPMITLAAEDVLRSGLFTSCREDVGLDRCNQPAEFVLWGRLFKPDALGPRCYDHAVAHTGRYMTPRPDQWAVIDLRPIRRALAHPPASPTSPNPEPPTGDGGREGVGGNGR